MNIGRSPEGKWLVLEGKKVLYTFETKEEAIAILRGDVPKEKKRRGCAHGRMTKLDIALGPYRWNQGWSGRFCRDCEWFFPVELDKSRKVRAVIQIDPFGEEMVCLLQKPRMPWQMWLKELARRKRDKHRWLKAN